MEDSITGRREDVSEHISRKELKQDKVRETFEHGAEAVLSHTRIASIAMLAVVIVAAGYFGWKFYSERQTNQAQAALDDAMKVFNAAVATSGQPALPGELTFSDASQRAQQAQTKLSEVASKYPRTNPGKLARYYSALCLMDMDRLNQAGEELKKVDAGSDKELAALSQYQMALIAERTGKTDDAVKMLRALSTSGSALVPKPMVLLELAQIFSQTDPKQASSLYEQLKKDYPNTSIADQADRGLGLLAPKS
jgi:predicted negative regulator of RcsB-dependent stress response